MWSVKVGEMYGCAIVWGMLDARLVRAPRKRQPCPFNDALRDEDVQHIVAVDGAADWNMPRELELRAIRSPYGIEVVGE